MIVRNVQQWYTDQKGEGLSPVVHYAYLTTLAWLKKPAASPHLKLHELAATCVATMRPTDAVWERMISTLRQYVAEGRMSDDESVAIVANGLTETLLSELDDDFGPDSGSINEAIERVRENLRLEHINAAKGEIDQIRSESNEMLKDANLREEAARKDAELARQTALDAKTQAEQAKTAIEELIMRIASVVGGTVRYTIIAGLLAGAIFAAANTVHSKHPVFQWIITSAITSVSVLSFLGSAWGISAKSVGERVEAWTARGLRKKAI
jgi:hypothetical protein